MSRFKFITCWQMERDGLFHNYPTFVSTFIPFYSSLRCDFTSILLHAGSFFVKLRCHCFSNLSDKLSNHTATRQHYHISVLVL